MAVLAKLTSKGQVTVPKEVRVKLSLKPGDTVVYEFEGDAVRLRRGEGFDVAWHRAVSSTLDEWASPEDDEAFRGL
jgi:antitoxin PrlF